MHPGLEPGANRPLPAVSVALREDTGYLLDDSSRVFSLSAFFLILHQGPRETSGACLRNPGDSLPPCGTPLGRDMHPGWEPRTP